MSFLMDENARITVFLPEGNQASGLVLSRGHHYPLWQFVPQHRRSASARRHRQLPTVSERDRARVLVTLHVKGLLRHGLQDCSPSSERSSYISKNLQRNPERRGHRLQRDVG